MVEEEEEDTPRNDQWVCPPRQTAASAPSASSPPAKSLLGTFPAILIVCHQGNITSHVCLIDRMLILIHLSADLRKKNPFYFGLEIASI